MLRVCRICLFEFISTFEKQILMRAQHFNLKSRIKHLIEKSNNNENSTEIFKYANGLFSLLL